MSVNDPVKWQVELAVRVQPTVRGREGEEVEVAGGFRWRWEGVGVWLRGRWFHCDSPCCHQRDGGPWVALSIPTWEACKWRGRAVIIYSPQLLTLDSELITAKGKSDRTWRVPEPVTLISVRRLRQEVREEELASVSFRCGFARACSHMFVCVSARWGGVGWGGPQLDDWTMTQVDTWWARSWTKMEQAYVASLLFILLALVPSRQVN